MELKEEGRNRKILETTDKKGENKGKFLFTALNLLSRPDIKKLENNEIDILKDFPHIQNLESFRSPKFEVFELE